MKEKMSWIAYLVTMRLNIYRRMKAHFNQPGHSSSDLRFLPFEVVHGDETLLSSREQYWIKKKRTFELGINRQK